MRSAAALLAAMLIAPSPAAAAELFGVSVTATGPWMAATVAATGAGLLVAVIGLAVALRQCWRAQDENEAEVSRLSAELSAAHALLNSERQAILLWSHDTDQPRLITYALEPELGVPLEMRRLSRFAAWLERESALALEQRFERLKESGEAFNQVLTTAEGANIEADGRPSGPYLVLRLRAPSDHGEERARLASRLKDAENDLSAFRSLLQALPIPAWLRDTEDRLIWVNQAYVSAVDEASAQEVIEGQVELLESRQRQRIDKALDAGKTFRERLQTIVGGERRSYDTVALPVGEASGGVAIDVAPLESARGELDRQMAAHARTLNRVATGVAIFGTDRRLNFYNEAFASLWQLPANWLEQRPTYGEVLDRLRADRLLPEQVDYRDWRARQMAAFDSAGADALQEDWWHLPDGRAIHVAADQRPDGGVTFLYDDVTEKLALESRYNALIRVQRETLDHLREGVAVFGSDGRLRLFNPAFSEIWGLDETFLGGSPHVDEVISVCAEQVEDPAPWEHTRGAVVDVQDERAAFDGQMTLGDGRVLAYAGVPLPDGATMMTYVDITDSKRVERALIERNEALEASDRLKNTFISHVSYELRTPLTNIIGFSELLDQPRVGELNARQREYLSDIRSSSQALLAIINDILDLATIDAGALELKKREADVREVIRSAELGVRERLSAENIDLDIEIAPDVDTLVADDKRVTQILYNLLSNAIGFSEAGRTISLNAYRQGDMIAFSVQDTGCGIPEDYQDSVFQRFETRPQGSQHRGAGLGLSLVKSLVELHNGQIDLRSAEGAGTTVTVLLPEDGQAKHPDEVEAEARLQQVH
ncbi:PAS domain-containing sensor histidine kinase [Dichotomicrobium thermohalophilum]|uniref:sensor histidine kinase n=1 Tax=Dichotomicrobium thermohalophilum TaxID=933063 RepID=UPI0014733E92|nr:PAS domain-containing sensor histidine kinase [Dichotomicrobium thermohalophilum]